jgi:hypothetical protein
MAQPVRIEGLRELQRDFKRISKDLDRGLTKELKDAAEPVRTEASMLALSNITNIPRTPRWAGMRIGVSRRGSVYVVPSARRRGGSPRPNFGGLLLEQMDRAVDNKEAEVLRNVESWLDKIGDNYGF